MKKRTGALLMALVMLFGLMAPAASAVETNDAVEAVYLGVKDFTTLDTDVTPEVDFVHLFAIDGETCGFTVATGEKEDYAIQNELMEGYIYNIVTADGVVTDVELQDKGTIEMGAVSDMGDLSGKPVYEITTKVGGAVVTEIDAADLKANDTVKVTENAVYKAFVAEDYEAPVAGTPGETTLKNFLTTALQPVGTAVYVYGGAWDWQDDVSSNQSMTIGIPQSWIDFFQAQDTTYHYKKTDANGSYANSVYTSNRGWNQYYYAGVDCSAYTGWVIYNITNTESSTDNANGYVGSSTKQAKNLSANGWGTWNHDTAAVAAAGELKVGDIVSMSGHVWVVLGVCEDGSVVFMHSTPSDSRDGYAGGGIQIASLNPNGQSDTDCAAYQLADHYMSTYYPQWYERYAISQKNYDSYLGTSSNANAGVFSWDLSGNALLTDPDGYADMTPTEILGDIFDDDFVPHLHAWGEGVVTTEATCTTEGEKTYTCECGKTKTEVIPATGHVFDDAMDIECNVCGASRDLQAEAVYLGVKDFTTLDTDVTPESEFVHRFAVEGVEVQCLVATGEKENYAIQNTLMEGYIYNIVIEGGVLTAAGEQDIITMGTVESAGDLGDKPVYEITTAVGGATVTKIAAADLKATDTVKVTENAVYKAFVAEEYTAPVAGTPGELTLKNFLTTALQPVGTALYVYGGCWDWEDDASSNQSMTIGIPQSWIDFFQSQDNTYHYKQKDENGSYANSVYTSNRGWNQYYYAGVDCSAYVGWVIYNVQNTESGVGEGYVMSATNQAQNFADLGWGTADRGEYVLNADGTIYADGDGDSHRIFDVADFKIGDVFSDNGHAWICLGVCEDGSMVFMHSTPSNATVGKGEGGGIQISALDLDGREDCMAIQLANHYMETYYPQWCERYAPVIKGSSYINVYDTGVPGTEGFKARKAARFSWDLSGNGLLTDPEGYADMTPTEILGAIFNDEFVPEKPAVEMPEAAAGTDYAGEAVYLGLKDFTTLDTDVTPETDFVHVFAIDGVPYGFTVATGEAEDYAIQNKLMEGYIYNITAAAGVVTAVELQDKGTILMGTIESIDGDTIVVDGETVTLGDVYEIATPTGGATITDNVKLYAGDTVKVTENAVYKAFVAEDYEAPVAGTPGKLTLKNFLTTALQPVGTALYVYGGCWDWEDDASSPQSTTIGLPQSWIDFFQSNDNTYHYKQKDANGSYANSVYTSNRGWNQYYYAGVDCSAYVAWTAYNVQNTESGGEGYVCSATNMAYNFAQNGWGTYDRGHQVMNADGTIYADGDGDSHRIFNMDDFKVGDVFSDNGHAWICLGVCEDDSMVFLHSTPSNATEGAGEGGGIQISALDLQGRETCEAYELACEYMEKYYPQWCERYTPVCRGESYVNVYDTGVPGTEGYKERKAGKMSWTLDGTGLLTDPDGYANMTPAEILEDIFEEDKGGSSGGSSKPSIRDDVEVVEPAKTTYTDVPETHWAYEAIEAVTEAGLFNGTSATTFSPEMDTTRGQLMTVLARLSGEKAATIAEGVAWAVANGVSDGTNPEANITREQLVTMLYRYAQLKGKDVSVGENTNILSYDDAASVSEWAIAAMQWACGEGIIKGMTESTLVPGGYATRAQIATIMQRYAGL